MPSRFLAAAAIVPLIVLLIQAIVWGQSKPATAAATSAAPAATTAAASNEPPPPLREFRAAWVASVGNIDWPSKPGLSTQQQQAEVIAILERAGELKMNAIMIQVRTSCDALYDSKLEPWSEYLTGAQGKPPDPYYDPLAFWIEEAHKRGIELHAWFNPFRARVGVKRDKLAENHVIKTHPKLVKDYVGPGDQGSYIWLDPGEPEAQDITYAVFMDVVKRYDVDGIHIDDYFYPYPVLKDPKNKDDTTPANIVPFPDDESYKKYTDGGGKLKRDDWRRENITKLIHRLYDGIKAEKKSVRFGISPFGIPRPGLKGIEYVKGFDQYEKLYADTVKWFQEGWCDYIAPQLYWKTGAPAQPYLGLARWWAENNPKGRNVYPGLFTSKIDWSDKSWSPDEIMGQVMISRLMPGNGGTVHFSMRALTQDRQRVASGLRDGAYAGGALVPGSPWLDDSLPPAPTSIAVAHIPAGEYNEPTTKPLPQYPPTQPASPTTKPATQPFLPLTTQPVEEVEKKKKLGAVRITWKSGEGEPAWVWAVYTKHGDAWSLTVVPGHVNEAIVRDAAKQVPASVVAVAAVDRCGNESKRTVFETGLKPPPKPATTQATAKTQPAGGAK